MFSYRYYFVFRNNTLKYISTPTSQNIKYILLFKSHISPNKGHSQLFRVYCILLRPQNKWHHFPTRDTHYFTDESHVTCSWTWSNSGCIYCYWKLLRINFDINNLFFQVIDIKITLTRRQHSITTRTQFVKIYVIKF